jgi:hypothetical protein
MTKALFPLLLAIIIAQAIAIATMAPFLKPPIPGGLPHIYDHEHKADGNNKSTEVDLPHSRGHDASITQKASDNGQELACLSLLGPRSSGCFGDSRISSA